MKSIWNTIHQFRLNFLSFFLTSLDSPEEELETDDDIKEAFQTSNNDDKSQPNDLRSKTDDGKFNPDTMTKERKRRWTFASSIRSSFSLCNSSKKKKTRHVKDGNGKFWTYLGSNFTKYTHYISLESMQVEQVFIDHFFQILR